MTNSKLTHAQRGERRDARELRTNAFTTRKGNAKSKGELPTISKVLPLIDQLINFAEDAGVDTVELDVVHAWLLLRGHDLIAQRETDEAKKAAAKAEAEATAQTPATDTE